MLIISIYGVYCSLWWRAEPVHKRQKMAAVWPHSIRHGREIATIMLIYIMALAYAPTSPLILPFALAYFAMSWCAARGQ